DIRDISTYLSRLSIYKKLPPEDKKAIRAMELVKLYNRDVIDIMDDIDKSPVWIRKVIVAAITLSLLGKQDLAHLAQVAKALDIDPRKARAIQQFLDFGKMLRPIGPHMGLWVQENLSQKDVDLIARLAGINESDLPYRIRGEKPPKTRHYKKPPVDGLNRINEDIYLFRIIRDYLRETPYDNEVITDIQVCSNKVAIVINEIQDAIRAIRAYPEKVKRKPSKKGIGTKQNHVDQFANIVNTFIRKNKYRLPSGITSEDLEAECWVCVLEAVESWDGTKSDINVWVHNKLEWKMKDLRKKEYQRQKTISRYLTHAEVLEVKNEG
ncbi:MAG: hypothetical protein WAL98_10355, partial [Desulfatiglandaceae bacterium]